ncbi:hypothetical protein [Brachybacterium sacelli]|uniref:hypothetical protein n=1 Tax=Brachybacterium sacelli TaxID=173364 RepID=UPI0036194898
MTHSMRLPITGSCPDGTREPQKGTCIGDHRHGAFRRPGTFTAVLAVTHCLLTERPIAWIA